MTVTALPLPEAATPMRDDLSIAMPVDIARSRGAGTPACATARTLGIPPSAWTPEREADTVPDLLSRICSSCPVQRACLRDAVLMNDIGYRASTTTAERHELFPQYVSPARARDDVDEPRALHAPGKGSLSRYRRGCRCDECRGSNAAARRRERAKAG